MSEKFRLARDSGTAQLPETTEIWALGSVAMNQLQSVGEQLAAADEFFLGHAAANDSLRYVADDTTKPCSSNSRPTSTHTDADFLLAVG